MLKSYLPLIVIIVLVLITLLIKKQDYTFYEDNTRIDYYSKNYPKIISPSGKKSISVFESGYKKESAGTQIMVDFGGGGGGIFAAEGTDLDIKVEWKDDNHIVVYLSKNIKAFKKNTKTQFFNDVVYINYVEK